MDDRGMFNTELESVMLTMLINFLPTNSKLLRRVRFLALAALVVRAWMKQQEAAQMISTAPAAPQVDTVTAADQPAGKRRSRKASTPSESAAAAASSSRSGNRSRAETAGA